MTQALRHIKTTLLLATLVAGLLCGCSDSADAPIPGVNGDSEGAITVVLRVPTDSPGCRDNPMPGEDGNGREQGILNENKVYDVNIFFFVGDGLNPADASVSVSGVYISDMSSAEVEAEDLPFEKKYTIKVPSGSLSSSVLNGSTTVSFATVVNAGRDLSKQFSTLADLRSYNGFDAAWQNSAASHNAGNCDRFVMTTAYDADADGLVRIGNQNRKVGSSRLVKSESALGADEPEWHGETTVQRICARIDLMYTQANIGGTTLVDGIPQNNSINHLLYIVPESGSKVHISNALPVNVMQKPSYFLTRVTEAIPTSWTENSLGTIKWGGIETTSNGSPAAPNNYVIEPRTLEKEGAVSDVTLAEWYGDSRAANVANSIKSIYSGSMDDYYSGKLPTAEPGFDCTHNTILGYANENVQSQGQFRSEYITGIVFRATYQPAKWSIYRDGVLTSKVLPDWTEPSVPSDWAGPANWTAMSDKSFTRYMPTVRGTNVVKDTEALYFASDAEARQYAADHPEDFATLTRYQNGDCYYNLWLRHYNDESADPQQTYPMEYAIVRNNIYRVALTFSGPGEAAPELREPDTMKARIFVRKWNLRQETNPLEF